MKFCFIAHPVTDQEMSMVNCLRYLNRSWGIGGQNGSSINCRGALEFLSFNITSQFGCAEGKIIYIPLAPEKILYDTDYSEKILLRVIKESSQWGARLVGLGGYFGIIGKRGVDVRAKSSISVTTGNTLTGFNAVAALEKLLLKAQIPVEDATVSIVGLPGSIGSLVAINLAQKGARLVLAGRTRSPYLEKFVAGLPNAGAHILVDDIHQAVQISSFIITCTSTGGIIKTSDIPDGRVVIDVAAPKDVIYDKKANTNNCNIIVFDGGCCSTNRKVTFQASSGLTTSFPVENLYGCLAETMILALEERAESYSIGKNLYQDKFKEIGLLAQKHGFEVNTLFSRGTAIDNIQIENWVKSFKQAHKKEKFFFRKDPIRNDELGIFERNTFDKDTAFSSYENFVNPFVTSLLKFSNMDKLYVKAKGTRVWDSEGNEYIDFVGGYGSVNLGHHHPKVVAAIEAFMGKEIPSFLQIAPQMLTAKLAQNLAQVTPGDLSICFFGNSGAEAVEGAIKLCRLATKRSAIISTKNSFHGKTCGALSATGREVFKENFGQLLPDVHHVSYGDLASLEAALRNYAAAAFIVEPVQGEGGVIVPPKGYLKNAQALCRKYGTLLIVDEIQTGFSRTGTLFACEPEEVVPDVMTLAKSLSGGIVPIGVYIARPQVWHKAYGSADRYALHTSTFGANNLAAAAGITALELLQEPSFIESVRGKGDFFRHKLKQLQKKYPDLICDVRGKGMLIGLEFYPMSEGGLVEYINQVQNYMAGTFNQIRMILPKDLINEGLGFLNAYASKIEKYLAKQFVLQLGSTLQNKFGILTFATLNNPYVMRIQPPLIITKEDIDYFVNSLDEVLKEAGL